MVNSIESKQEEISSSLELLELLEIETDPEMEVQLEDSVTKYTEIVSDIEAVWVTDLKDNKVWANTKIEPDVEAVGELQVNENETISLIFERELARGLKFENETFIISDDFIKEFDTENIWESIYDFGHQEEIIKFRVWYLH